MKSNFMTVLLGTTFCAVISACNDGASVAKSALATAGHAPDTGASTTTPPGTDPVVNPPIPTHVETFAQSLESFSFTFTKSTRKVSVSFASLAPESADPEGILRLHTTQEFEGEIPRGASAAVLAPRAAGSDYSVRVDCADDTCASTTIQIDRLRGTLSGRAVLTRESHEMNAQLNRNMPNGRLTTSRDPLTSMLAELSNRDNLSAIVTASVTKVTDGRHEWFDVRYEFLPQPFMRADQPGYFDDKSVVISGDLGQHQPLKVTRSIALRDSQIATSAAVYGSVKVRPTPFALSVTFERPDLRNPTVTVTQSMGDSLSF